MSNDLNDTGDRCDHSTRPSGGYRALVDNFPNGVLVLFDADLRYRIVGPSELPFSGREADSLEGRTARELFREEHFRQLEPVLEATLAGEPRSIDIEYEGRIHRLVTKPVRLDGVPYGVLVTQDVTAARRTEDALARRNERLDEFASMVSHDLRNPLSVATGRLDLYRETGDASHLDDVEASLDRIDELTADLLTLARDGASSHDREPVSLADVARTAWDGIDSRSATLETRDCTVSADEGQLRVLLENLLRNAVGHGGAEVTVRVGPLPEGDGFAVADTGRGIPPAERERVLEHGFSTGYGGSGVGLTIVARIAEAHGWDVDVGESPEGGARFVFRRHDDAE